MSYGAAVTEDDLMVGKDTTTALAELRTLWPRLGDASAPDRTSGGAVARRGGRVGPGAPVNVEVVDAVRLVEVEAGELYEQVRRSLGMRLHRGGTRTDVILDELATYRAALAVRVPALLPGFDAAVARWLRAARRALLLTGRPRRLPVLCPDHRDGAPTHLEVAPDEHELHPAILASGDPAAARVSLVRADARVLPAEAALTVVRSKTVCCPQCDRSWTGLLELAELQRLL